MAAARHGAAVEGLIGPTRPLRARAREWTSSGRVLPRVVLAGVQKGGTTSLYHQLKVHPNVLWLRSKGAHFFDLHYDRGLPWYRSLFPHRARVALQGARVSGDVITAESTGYYFDHPLAPARCAETLPDVRVVIMLRDPIARAYSAYHDAVGKGLEPLSFDDALAREPDRLAGEVEKLRADPGYESLSHRHLGYLTRGIYVDAVARWFDALPKSQVLVLQSEAFFRDMETEYDRVLRFAGLPDWKPARFEKRNTGAYAEMSPATRERLAAFFEPHNRRLYDLLGASFGWA